MFKSEVENLSDMNFNGDNSVQKSNRTNSIQKSNRTHSIKNDDVYDN